MGSGQPDGKTQIIVTTTMLLLAMITVAGRLIIRFAVLRSAGIDDYLIMIAIILSTGQVSMLIKQVSLGQGTPTSQLPLANVEALVLKLYQSVIVYIGALTSTKLSILFLYLRFFRGRKTRILTYSLIVFVAVASIGSILLCALACTPIRASWDIRVKGHCLSNMLVWFTAAGLALFSDLAILILPMPVVSSLKLPRRQRLELISVFGLGSIACLITIIRLHILYDIAVAADVALDNGLPAIISSTEVNIGIMCASIPCWRSTIVTFYKRMKKHHLFRNIFPKASDEPASGPDDVPSFEFRSHSRDVEMCCSDGTDTLVNSDESKSHFIAIEKTSTGNTAGLSQSITTSRSTTTSQSTSTTQADTMGAMNVRDPKTTRKSDEVPIKQDPKSILRSVTITCTSEPLSSMDLKQTSEPCLPLNGGIWDGTSTEAGVSSASARLAAITIERNDSDLGGIWDGTCNGIGGLGTEIWIPSDRRTS
ncbi:hypothetical protein AAFC00_005204 [Neodothiora populina]|uniref:Rhodopsin domain-containing protein n=1 Tax=Neodothiora populina TaxID=2781224 RepID=A0ABR3PK41_9PEZI